VSRRLSRLAFGGSAAALALVLVVPSAALADDDHGQDGDHGTSGEHATSEHATSGEHGRAGEHGATQSAGAGDADGHNPPGNNGTIKIDYAAPADSGHATRPHPGCAFQLRMFGFDDDQYGSVTFVGQAPTKLGTLLTQTHVLLSDDAAGGGQDVDAVYAYTAQQLGLTSQPQAKQGWHIKVSVDADNAPGGAKHKVFWLKCESTPAGTTTTITPTPTSGTASASATQSTVSTKSVSTSGSATGATTGAATAEQAAVSSGAAACAGRAAAATAGSATAGRAGEAAATTSTRGSALPFTGFGLATAVLVALAALLAGGLAVAAGRRRTSAV
jgi:hypothetical protein